MSFGAQWRAARPAVLASVPTWFATWGVGQLLGPRHALAGLVLSLCAGLLVFAATVSVLDPGVLRRAAGYVFRMIGRSPAPASA